MLLPIAFASGCGSDPRPVTRDYCLIESPMPYEAGDTADTVRRIIDRNVRYYCICEAPDDPDCIELRRGSPA